MLGAKENLAERMLHRLSDSICRHPRWYFYPQVVLFLVCVFYTVDALKFSTDRNALVGSEKLYHHNYLEFRKEFSVQDDLVAVIESDDLVKNRQFVERLAVRLEAQPEVFTNVFYKGDLKLMGPKALLFLPEDTLVEFRQTLSDFRPFIVNFSQATNLGSLFRLVNQQFRTAPQEATPETESMLKALPALERILTEATDSLNRPGLPPSPGVAALFDGGQEAEQSQYITFAQGRLYLVTAHARVAARNFEAVEHLRAAVQATQIEVPGVNAGVTGEPVLEYDEMKQSQYDTTVATIVSLVIVAFLFIYGFSETGRPLKAMVCLLVGLGYTMGFATLVVGHLNILTITFLPMLIGLAIDFGVHLISRYEEEIRGGRSEPEALRLALVNTGMGIFTAAFTTAGAFLAMGLTDFEGIKEMGLISGGGLLICLVPMMTMLPALLLRGTQNVIDHQAVREMEKRERIERLWLDRPGIVIGVSAVLTALSLLQFGKVYFDYNLLHLQTKGLETVALEHKLIHSATKSVLFGAVTADSLPEAVALERRLTNLSTVASVDSMAQFLSEKQDRKLELVRAVKAEVSGIEFATVDPQPVDLLDLSQTLYGLGGYLGQALTEVRKENDAKFEAQLLSLTTAIDRLRTTMLNGDRGKAAEKLGQFQRALLDDVRETFRSIRNQDARERLRPEDLPITLRNRFVGRSGKLLLQVYPKGDVWQRDQQEAFVRELRTVDPNVTGTPVQLYEYTTLLKDSYVEAAWYALGAIVILVLVHFRNLSSVVLSLLPVALGACWMAGLMGLLGIPFNPANIMTLPLVIGIGVTSGIHILNRFSEEENPSILAKSTGKAVLISALTTIAGFGSLMLAAHQGIESLGYVMSIGTATCMIAALTFLPAMLNVLVGRGWKIKTQRQ
jgi:uncharacterized protein